MKPGEMSAEQKLLRQYATAMYAYTNAEVDSEEEKQAEVITDKLEAELLARLNAGGALAKVASLEPCEDCVWHGCQGGCGCKCHKKGASQPLQARCPKCGGSDLSRSGSFVDCHGCASEFSGIFDVKDYAQFFSAPPATYLKQCVAEGTNCDCKGRCKFDVSASPASPQLEQVAREIAAYVRGEFLKPLVCKPENDYLLDGLVPILQRHFPGSEGAAPERKSIAQTVRDAYNNYFQAHPGWEDEPGAMEELKDTVESLLETVTTGLNPEFTALLAKACEQIESSKEGAASPPVAAADFKTVNDCIEALNDAAELLIERHSSTGFDASVALIIEQTVQRLKSIETEAAPLAPRKEPMMQAWEFDRYYNGTRMAQGIKVEAATLEEAAKKAADEFRFDAQNHRDYRVYEFRLRPSPKEKGAEK